jgi:hypothetical protein
VRSSRSDRSCDLRRIGRNGLIDGVSRREIDGLVVDETQTEIGRDFFEVFYAAWERPAGAMNHTVRIQEQPSPSLGTRVVCFWTTRSCFSSSFNPGTRSWRRSPSRRRLHRTRGGDSSPGPVARSGRRPARLTDRPITRTAPGESEPLHSISDEANSHCRATADRPRLFVGASPAGAQEMVDRPLNPAFGGIPMNYRWVLSSAQAQKRQPYATARFQRDPLRNHTEGLQRQVLSALSREVATIASGGTLT